MKSITKKLINGLLTVSMLAYSMAMPTMAEANRNAYEPVYAKEDQSMAGGNNHSTVLTYTDVDFGELGENERITGAYAEIANDSPGGTLTITADPTDTSSKDSVEKTGKLIAYIKTSSTGGWDDSAIQKFKSEFIAYNSLSGLHDIYVTFSSTTVGNFKSFCFEKSVIENGAWGINEEIDVNKCNYTNASRNGTHIGGNSGSTYIRINDVDFGDSKITEFSVASATEFDGYVAAYVMPNNAEAADRADIDANGIKIAQVQIAANGSWSNFEWQNTETIENQITGIHDVYLTTGNPVNLTAIKFGNNITYKNPYAGIPARDDGGMEGGNTSAKILVYTDVDFGKLGDNERILNAYAEIANGSNGGTLTITADATDLSSKEAVEKSGKVIAEIKTSNTGGWSDVQEFKSEFVRYNTLSGVHDLFVTFSNTMVGDFKGIRLEKGVLQNGAWGTNEEIDVTKCNYTNASRNGTDIGGNDETTYIQINDVNFGEAQLTEFSVNAATEYAGNITAYVMPENAEATGREDIDNNGIKIAQVSVKTTGAWDNYVWQKSETIENNITGIHHIYLTTTKPVNIKAIRFGDAPIIIYKDPYEGLKASDADSYTCSLSGNYFSRTKDKSYAVYENVDFGDTAPNYMIIRKAVPEEYAGGRVCIYTDSYSPENEAENLVTEMRITATEGFSSYDNQYITLDEEAKAKLVGVKNLYVVFRVKVGAATGNFEWIRFGDTLKPAYDRTLFGEYADSYSSNLSRGTGVYNGENHIKFGSTNRGYYICYKNVDFGQFAVKNMSMIYGAPEQTSEDGKANAKISVYLDSTSTTPIYSDLAENTGGYSQYAKCGPYAVNAEVTGVHDVYVTFGYSGTCDFMGIEFASKIDGLTVMDGSLNLWDIDGEILETAPNGQILSNYDFVQANCTIANNTSEDKTAVIILAVYTADGKLVAVETNTQTFAKGTVTPDFSTYIDFAETGTITDLTGYIVKPMVWTGFDNGMIPLPGGSL